MKASGQILVCKVFKILYLISDYLSCLSEEFYSSIQFGKLSTGQFREQKDVSSWPCHLPVMQAMILLP